MSRIKLFPHQAKALEDTEKLNKVAYYLDMRNRLRQNFRGFRKDGAVGVEEQSSRVPKVQSK